MRAVQEIAPDAEVDAVTRETRGDQVVYFMSFKNQKHAPVYITAEGVPLAVAPAVPK